MQKFAKFNKGIKFILVVINVFTKFAYAEPIKSKNANDVTNAMSKILIKKNVNISHLHTDFGKEFFNAKFQELMKKYGINHYYTYSTMKASVVERLNRTIKAKIWKNFSLRGAWVFYDVLEKIICEYNSTKHRTVGMKHCDVKKTRTTSFIDCL